MQGINEKFKLQYESMVAEVARLKRKIDGFRVTGAAFVNGPESMALNVPQQRKESAAPTPPFWIELTAAGSTDGFYNWKKVYYKASDDSWSDADPAVTGTNTARESNLATGLYNSSDPHHYLAQFYGFNGDGDPVFIFTAGGVGGLFPVTLSQSGGSDGDGTTRASWTYTVTSLGGDELGTNIAVVKTRILPGSVTKGTVGVAYWDLTGTIKLWDTNEYWGAEVQDCS